LVGLIAVAAWDVLDSDKEHPDPGVNADRMAIRLMPGVRADWVEKALYVDAYSQGKCVSEMPTSLHEIIF